jgi:hypothetical protein
MLLMKVSKQEAGKNGMIAMAKQEEKERHKEMLRHM